MVVDLDNTNRMMIKMMIIMMMMIMIIIKMMRMFMMKITKKVITCPILKPSPPDFACGYTWILLLGDDDSYNDNDNNDHQNPK